MACSQKPIKKSLDHESERREESHLPSLHERFVVFVRVFIVTEKIDRSLKNVFQAFCSWILERKGREIQTFIREQPENSRGQDCVILRLTSWCSTCVVLKEAADGFTAHICCQEGADSSPAIKWISEVASEFGYKFQGVHERKSMKSFTDATIAKTTEACFPKADEIVLSSVRCQKFKEALKYLSEIFSSCICSDNNGSSEEAYEQAKTSRKTTFFEGHRIELQTEDPIPTANHQNEIDHAKEWINNLSGDIPTGGYACYHLLLQNIADSLQFEDVSKVKIWVTRKFNIDVISQGMDQLQILKELDKQKIISLSNLQVLKELFEEVLRFDMIHLIDCYLAGDYKRLKVLSNVKNSCLGTDSRCCSIENGQTGSARKNFNFGGGTRNTRPGYGQDATAATMIHGMTTVKDSDAIRYQPQGIYNQQGVVDYAQMGKVAATKKESVVDPGTNGKKLSKFLDPNGPSYNCDSSPRDTNDDIVEGPWLCKHYKRRCHVKFDCCNQYWPCHRCHNNESKCGKKKLKSRDTKSIKCTRCGTEQKFSEKSQFCIKCSMKFAKYFCASCKHLTGTDDHPFHCAKCGICRIHSDRSFHCDVCGVCLDTKLENNHKCRPGSAHDECCICLEDAFSGCQILPCSHKVHKDCATLMIRSGITRCPICRESFAHRLEKRSILNPGKTGAKE